MEARTGKGLSNRSSAASKIAAVGKENICPALRSRGPLSVSRSPLPEGFPRAPLQDITDILSPTNFLPNDDDGDVTELGLCRRGRKRSAETQMPSCISRSECELILSEEWRGLRKCATLQAASSHTQVKGESKLMEGVRRQSLSNVTESTILKDEDGGAGTVEIKEESLLCGETRVTEQTLAEGVLKTDVVEESCPLRPLRTIPKRPLKLSSPSPATRASLRSSQAKQKMSSLMKFR